MKKTDEKIIPLRISAELHQDIAAVSERADLSAQDVMRLCLRIGLVDLKAAEHDIPGIVQKIAADKGVSFSAFAKDQTTTSTPHRQDVTYQPGTEGLGYRTHGLNEPILKEDSGKKSATSAAPELESTKLFNKLAPFKKK